MYRLNNLRLILGYFPCVLLRLAVCAALSTSAVFLAGPSSAVEPSLPTIGSTTTVAMAVADGGETGRAVLELAGAELCRQPGLVLVERLNVERLLKEQDLTKFGSGQSGQAYALNSMLGADVFAVLETDKEKKSTLGMLVYDANSGVTLGYTPLEPTNTVGNAATVVKMIEAACRKRRLPVQERVLVSLVSLRNVDLPRTRDAWCDAIGVMLMRRLVASPDVAVLNRGHLGFVNREVQLTGTRHDVMAALLRIELEFNLNGTNGACATLLLKDSKGVTVAKHTAASSPADSGALVKQLQEWLLATLHSHPSEQGMSNTQEAEQFAYEAECYLAQGNLDQAYANAEAAIALDPTSAALHVRMGALYYKRGWVVNMTEYTRKDVEQLNPLLRSLELTEKGHRLAVATTGSPQPDGPEMQNYTSFYMELGGFLLYKRDAVPRFSPIDRDEVLQSLKQLHHQICTLVVELTLPHLIRKGRTGGDITVDMDDFLRTLDQYGPPSAVWSSVMAGVPAALEYYRTHPMELGWVRRCPRMMARLCCMARGIQKPCPLAKPSVNYDQWIDPALSKPVPALREVFEFMQSFPDPCVKNYGLLGELALDDYEGKVTKQEKEERINGLRARLRNEAKSPSRLPDETYREIAFGTELDLIDTMIDDPNERARQYLDLFGFMIQERRVDYWVANVAMDPTTTRFRHYADKYCTVDPDRFPCDTPVWTTNDYPALVMQGQQLRNLLKAGNYAGSGLGLFSWRTGSFPKELDRWQKPIFDLRPDLIPKSEGRRTWSLARRIADSVQLGGDVLAFLDVQSNSVTTITGHTRDSKVAEIRSDGSVSIVKNHPPVGNSGMRIQEITLDGNSSISRIVMTPDASMSKAGFRCYTKTQDALFIGTSDGIFKLGGNLSVCDHWGVNEGLPDGGVQSMAVVDDELYAVLDGGYIVCHDLRSASWEILASSRRKEKKSAFDDMNHGWSTRGLIADPIRHRVIFSVTCGQAANPMHGLWAIDTKTHAIVQLLATQRMIYGMHELRSGEILLATYGFRTLGDCEAPPHMVITFDPRTDKGRLIASSGGGGGAALPLEATTLRLQYYSVFEEYGVTGLALSDHDLWYQKGWISRKTKKSGDYPPLQVSGKNVPIVWHMMAPLPDGRTVLAYNGGDQALWLLLLSDDNAK